MCQNKGERIPFPLQIALILLCGVVLSVLAVVGIRGRTPDEMPDPDSDQVYWVTFAQPDGTVIERKPTHKGKGVVPPEYGTEGVFRGWSSSFNMVTADVETHPMVYQVADENLFCFDSVYVQEGDSFEICLNLVGAVNISSADLTIEYDPLVMEYTGSENAGYCVVNEETPGTLSLELRSEIPIREAVRLSELTFFAKPENVYSTQITLHCANAKLSTSGGEAPVTVSTLNNQIFYLQEVE